VLNILGKFRLRTTILTTSKNRICILLGKMKKLFRATLKFPYKNDTS